VMSCGSTVVLRSFDDGATPIPPPRMSSPFAWTVLRTRAASLRELHREGEGRLRSE